MDALVDLSDYLTEEEIASYVDGYIDEGRFGEGVKIFPIAKSVEVLILNKTEWDKFAAATGASYDDLSTVESLTAAAEAYYNWTDSLTDTPNDGKALFGESIVVAPTCSLTDEQVKMLQDIAVKCVRHLYKVQLK